MFLQACKGEDLGKVEFDEEIKKRFKMVYVPNWFSVDLKTGVSAKAVSSFRGLLLQLLPLSWSCCSLPTDAHHHAGRERLLRCLGVCQGRRLLQLRRIRPQV